MKINAAVFDLDGTLTDTLPLTIHSLKTVTRQLTGKELSDSDILKEFGPVDTKIIRKLVGNDLSDICEDIYIKHFTDNFHNYVQPLEGIKELLDFIKASSIKLGLYTGRGLRATLIILEKLNLTEYFDEILSGDSVSKPKPDPEGIIKILGKLGVEPNQGVYTGDFDVDILASKAAGTVSVLALWSSTASSDFKKLDPDKFFTSPFQFIDWIKTNKAGI